LSEFFEYKLDRSKNEYVIASRDYESIKKKLLKRHENGGRPIIMLENLKYKTGNEVLLRHQFDQQPLDSDYVKMTLKMLHRIINRPVNIKTVDVEVISSTQYYKKTPIWSSIASDYLSQTTDEIKHTPVIYRYDGARFTRVKDERSVREAASSGEGI
jgi:spore cortex formation protein SpoVR/YcgB (stage V sporulation)